MPRPQRRRRICALPVAREFVPERAEGGCGPVVLQLDEYEAIRLLDLEGMTQEQCAAQMAVARTTVTAIYESARRKLADAVVNGKRLVIQGGNYRLCEESCPKRSCGGHGCLRQHCRSGLNHTKEQEM